MIIAPFQNLERFYVVCVVQYIIDNMIHFVNHPRHEVPVIVVDTGFALTVHFYG
jgi:hypothetical protein